MSVTDGIGQTPCSLEHYLVNNKTLGRCIHLQLVDGDPGVRRIFEQHRDKELKTAVPVTDKQHDADEVEDSHEHSCYTQKLTQHTPL